MTTSPSSSGRGAGPTDPSDILADVRGSDRVAQARHQFEITADGIIKLVKQVLPEESVRDEFWIMLRSMIDGCFQIGQSAGEASEGIMQMQEHLDGVKSQMELHARQTELHASSVRALRRGG